ncbi:MAG: hypothetical protein HYZ00_10015, partial [Candidatus Hydrogenedentes bacterium]|nr:hypothetical protein [Candidatus Hydrogenedentota bacterium]
YLTDLNVIFCPSDSENLSDLLGNPGKWTDANGNILISRLDGDPRLPGYDADIDTSDRSYIYLGWAIPDNSYIVPVTGILSLYIGIALTPFNAAQYATVESNNDTDHTYDMIGGNSIIPDGAELQIRRFREGIERFFITDINNPAASNSAQSEIAVIWDVSALDVSLFNHVPGGSNVLYMDGHVEFVKYVGNGSATIANGAAGTENEQFPVSSAWAIIAQTALNAGV